MYITAYSHYIDPTLYGFVKEAFKGIKTKDGHDYFEHCMTVVNFALNLANEYKTRYFINMEHLAALALCHDVIEDLPKEVADALEIKLFDLFNTYTIYEQLDEYLTYRKKTQTRKQYIDNIANSNNIYVRLVKMADLIHNSLISRSKTNPPNLEEDIARITKYSVEFNQIKLSFSQSSKGKSDGFD